MCRLPGVMCLAKSSCLHLLYCLFILHVLFWGETRWNVAIKAGASLLLLGGQRLRLEGYRSIHEKTNGQQGGDCGKLHVFLVVVVVAVDEMLF